MHVSTDSTCICGASTRYRGGQEKEGDRPVSGQSKHVTIYLATDKADKRTSRTQKMDENGMEKARGEQHVLCIHSRKKGKELTTVGK